MGAGGTIADIMGAFVRSDLYFFANGQFFGMYFFIIFSHYICLEVLFVIDRHIYFQFGSFYTKFSTKTAPKIKLFQS